jgi:hypothetical protein
MVDCSVGGQIGPYAFMFLIIFVPHAIIFGKLFARWEHRYYWGLLPALFSTLALLMGIYWGTLCSLYLKNEEVVYVYGGFFLLNFIVIEYFRPNLFWDNYSNGRINFGIVGILSMSGFGFLVSFIWLLMSFKKKMLIGVIDTDRSKRDRLFSAVMMIAAFGVAFMILVYVVWSSR